MITPTNFASRTSTRRLATIPGIGPVIASRLSAMVPDPFNLSIGAAWIGLVPNARSFGSVTVLIARQTDRFTSGCAGAPVLIQNFVKSD